MVDPSSSGAELDAALDILSNWRASHAYPMHAATIRPKQNFENKSLFFISYRLT